jgi:hypothetical protein
MFAGGRYNDAEAVRSFMNADPVKARQISGESGVSQLAIRRQAAAGSADHQG